MLNLSFKHDNGFVVFGKGALPGIFNMLKMLYLVHGKSLPTHVIVLNEIAHPEHRRSGWRLYLQWARYQYDDRSEPETGYRFIWRRPDGSLQPARGQARIPSLADAELLIRLARELGWADHHADDALSEVQ
jgi:hypothetical protein